MSPTASAHHLLAVTLDYPKGPAPTRRRGWRKAHGDSVAQSLTVKQLTAMLVLFYVGIFLHLGVQVDKPAGPLKAEVPPQCAALPEHVCPASYQCYSYASALHGIHSYFAHG